MAVQQLSVFLENKAGRIAEVLRLLGDQGVHVFGFMAPDTTDYGIARLVVDRAEESGRFLRDGGFTAVETEVICVGLVDGPCALSSLAELLAGATVNVDYMYLTTTRSAVLKVDDIEHVEAMLTAAGLCVLDQKDVAPR